MYIQIKYIHTYKFSNILTREMVQEEVKNPCRNSGICDNQYGTRNSQSKFSTSPKGFKGSGDKKALFVLNSKKIFSEERGCWKLISNNNSLFEGKMS